jgi:RHS repeat-associated protein
VTPPAGGTATTTITDAQDHVVELRQHTSAAGVDGAYDATTYVYDAQGRTTKVTDAAQNVWQYTFDPRGRVTKTKDPDKGTVLSEYNEYGDLTKTTDASGEVLVYEYDTLGRKIGLYDDTISAATKRAGWTWDFLYDDSTARGKLTASVRYENGNAYRWQVRGFNRRYQPTGVNYVIPAETGLANTYTYAYGFADTDGSPTTATFPAAGGLATETVTTGYDETTGLASTLTTNLPGVGSYVAAQRYSSYGEPTVTTRKTAGGVYTENGYVYDTATRRVARAEVLPETSTGMVSRVDYVYDAAGNITSLADAPEVGAADTQCFNYDALRRLTSAWTPKSAVTCGTAPSAENLGGAAPYWTDWTIDKIGNRTREVQHTTVGDTTRTYTVPASGANSVLPHAATAVTTQVGSAAATTEAIGYTAAGSVATRTGPTGAAQTITWDPEGRPATMVEGSSRTTQLFDADGTRLLRRDPTGTTLFLPGLELRREGTGAVTATRTYAFAGATIASRVPGENGLTWIFGDHQGTGQIAVNAATQHVTIRRQTPYGAARGAAVSWPTTKGFVGGDLDPTGLIQLGARQYDPVTGRFLSVDPVIDFTDPQQMNAYSYAQNTPVTMMDPDGQRPLIGESLSDDRRIMEKEGITMRQDRKGKWRVAPRYPSPRKDPHWPTVKTTETGRNTLWNRYLYMSQAQIDARAHVVNNWSIATALGAYYTGAGPEVQNWYQIDEMTMGIRGSDHMDGVRDLMTLMLSLGDYPAQHKGDSLNFDLPSGMEGNLQAGKDISNMGKNGLQGDPAKRQSAAASAVGSYKLGYEVVAVDPDKGRAVVAFHGTNRWDKKSGMRPPWIDKKDWNPVEPTSGPQRPVNQNFYWAEVINFTPAKPGE